MVRYSVIIPSWDNCKYLSLCVGSVLKNTKNFELIVVLNGPNKDSLEFLKTAKNICPSVSYLFFPDQISFSAAVNAGLHQATGRFLILLNDDTIVTPLWADHLSESFEPAEKYLQVSPIGIVGPVTNNAGGSQAIDCDPYEIEDLPVYAPEHYKKNKSRFLFTGFLSGFCMMIKYECYRAVGDFDNTFLIGGFEDNDYCVRAYKLGWKTAVVQSVFIHHYGQRSLSRIGQNFDQIFEQNRIRFTLKHLENRPQKLAVITRIHNGMPYLKNFLINVTSFADMLIVVLDRCTDGSESVINLLDFPTETIIFNEGFDEIRDRQALIDSAVKRGATWILSLDCDEIMEASFTRRRVESLMIPKNPETFAYMFSFRNFWLGRTNFRTDGVFGSMVGLRMFKIVPHINIRSLMPNGLHCTHVPLTPYAYIRHLRDRILHFGYDDESKCLSKYRFYTELDPNPDKNLVGPEGYRHLISRNVSLRRFNPVCTLGLGIMVKNEAPNLFNLLNRYYHGFDQIVIIDTGSIDHPDFIANIFGAEYFKYSGKFDFSSVRNFMKSKMTTSWILTMDCDEDFKDRDFEKIYDLIEDSPDGYLFQVANFMPDGSIGYSDNVRLIRNEPWIEWSGFVHENVSRSMSSHGGVIGLAPVNIRHYGYLKIKDTQTRKSKLYQDLLISQIKKNPDEAIGYFHLAFFYREKGNETKFIELLQKTLTLEPKFFLSQKELGLHFLEKSTRYFNDLAGTIPQGHFFHDWAQSISAELNRVSKTPAGRLA